MIRSGWIYCKCDHKRLWLPLRWTDISVDGGFNFPELDCIDNDKNSYHTSYSIPTCVGIVKFQLYLCFHFLEIYNRTQTVNSCRHIFSVFIDLNFKDSLLSMDLPRYFFMVLCGSVRNQVKNWNLLKRAQQKML